MRAQHKSGLTISQIKTRQTEGQQASAKTRQAMAPAQPVVGGKAGEIGECGNNSESFGGFESDAKQVK